MLLTFITVVAFLTSSSCCYYLLSIPKWVWINALFHYFYPNEFRRHLSFFCFRFLTAILHLRFRNKPCLLKMFSTYLKNRLAQWRRSYGTSLPSIREEGIEGILQEVRATKLCSLVSCRYFLG